MGAADAAIPVAHVVDARPGRIAELLAHQYSDAGNYPFCLVLRGDDPAALAREALLLFFHPKYVIGDKGRTVFVEGGCVAVERLLREQRLEVEAVAVEDAKRLDGRDPAGDYYRYCVNSYAPEDLFLLSGDDIAELPRAERMLAEDHERFYRLAMERVGLSALAAEQRREIGRLREERQILQELLELSNKHDEVNYILRFYRNEYEVLPLWYKRIGHIVKVLLGKRSFRSLFDKSVKKYKD